jgi:hypothetical protein
MCDEEYGPAQAPLRDMLWDSTATRSREDFILKEAQHLPAWARENPATFFAAVERYERANGHCSTTWEIVLPRGALGADAALTAPCALQGRVTMPGRKLAGWRDGGGEGLSLRHPLPAPPAGGEQAGEASLRLEFLPLVRRYPFPHRHRGEG